MARTGLPSTLYVCQRYGPVAASTATAPFRYPRVKFGPGLLVEEGTTNLVTNPTAEIDAAGYAVINAQATVARSTLRAFAGAASILVTRTNNTGDTVVGYDLAGLTAGTYTSQWRVFVGTAGTKVQMTAGPAGGAATSSTATATPGAGWVLLTVTTTLTAGQTLEIRFQQTATAGGPAPVGSAFSLDAGQTEQKAYATSYCDGTLGSGYAWTGTPHASTSTRAAAQVQHASPFALFPSSATLTIWCRVPVAGVTSRLVTLGNSPSGEVRLAIATTNVEGVVAGASGTAILSPNAAMAPGDVVFLALTYTAAGATLTYSINGGAAVTVTSATATGIAGTSLTTLQVGALARSAQSANTAVEQVLVHNAALTASEIAALAFATGPTDMADDPRIVYAAVTRALRQQTTALTVAGTGSFRTVRSLDAGVDQSLVAGAPTGTTAVITTEPSSGIGQGDVVSFLADASKTLTVLAVDSLPGSGDLLYAA